jgi:hypothetical protein
LPNAFALACRIWKNGGHFYIVVLPVGAFRPGTKIALVSVAHLSVRL